MIPRAITRRRLRRRLATSRIDNDCRMQDDLVASLAHIHRLLLSGSSLRTAIAHAVHARPCRAIEALHDRLIRGEPIGEACRSLVDTLGRLRHPSFTERDAIVALHVLSVTDTIGGRSADHMETLIDDLNERDRVRRERRAQATTPLASMRMLTWLPILCGTWILLDSRAIRDFLFGSPAGWACLVLGIGSNVLGRVWLHREVNAC